MPTTSTELAQWVEAIGTAAAVFVAILTTLYFEVWKPRRERPKLEIYYDNADPRCRRFSPAPAGSQSSYFIRLRVANNGNAPAQGCIGRLVAIANENLTLRDDWDISGLTWSMQSMPQPIYLSPKGDYFFLDVASTRENEHVFRLRVDPTPRAIKLEYEPGQYYFQIVVYAEKADPVEQWFRVNWQGEFDKFSMEKTGKPGQMRTIRKMPPIASILVVLC
jgi:hypothetical protein